MDSQEKKKFVARAVAWAVFACGLPVAFIGWRYDLFRSAGELQFSGWGMIAIVIVLVFLIVVVKYVKALFTEWSMTKQIISGVLKIILPLGALLALCVGIRSNLDYFIQALSCVIICEAMAIPMNPFPELIYKKTEGRYDSMTDYAAAKIGEKRESEKEDKA